MQCATHPDVETGLRCGKCDKPICPRCMVETPVGMKCRECARLRKLPVFEVSASYYARAAAAGLGLAAVIGIVWAVLLVHVAFAGFFNFFIAAGAGYGVGELVGLSVRRKRGVGLAVIGGIMTAACCLLAFLVFPPLLGMRFGLSPWQLLYAVVAVVSSVGRLK